MRMFLIVPLLALGLVCAARAEPTEDEKQWLEHILLGANPATPGVGCTRWTKGPRLSVFGATSAQTKAVEAAIEELNFVLTATPIQKIDTGKANDASADIKVHFAPEKEFPILAKKYDFRFEKGSRTYCWLFWDGKRELTQAVALIPADAKGDELKRFTLREVTRSLGMPGNAPQFDDSIFFRKGAYGTSANELSRRDRKLIGFFYNKIQPGAKQAEVRANYKSW